MLFEITFLDWRRRASRYFTGSFSDKDHARRFALAVMAVAAGRRLSSAEIASPMLRDIIHLHREPERRPQRAA